MPKTAKSTKSRAGYTKNHTKRQGKHHKRSNRYSKVYAPYLPLLLSIIASIFLSIWQPVSSNTLAYATDMSTAGLLSSTNTQRSTNGKQSLTLNAKLSNAAQSKANHMVKHNYWSHTTPDGQEPWVFIQNAGYNYTKAGENLAYGFASSAEAVIGWMNSPTHKANMLDGAFTDVGFGFANSSNFNSSGKQTVVVAMYGKPQVLSTVAPTSDEAPKKPAETQQTPIVTAPAESKPPATSRPKETTRKKPTEKQPTKNEAPVTTEQPIAAAMPISQNISKVQSLTMGHAPWALGAAVLTTGFAIILLLLRHSLKTRHMLHDLIHNTERFVLHHPLLDSTLLGIALLGTVLSHTVGTIL